MPKIWLVRLSVLILIELLYKLYKTILKKFLHIFTYHLVLWENVPKMSLESIISFTTFSVYDYIITKNSIINKIHYEKLSKMVTEKILFNFNGKKAYQSLIKGIFSMSMNRDNSKSRKIETV